MRTSKFNTIHIIRCIFFIPSISNNHTINISLTIGVNAVKEFLTIYTCKFSISINRIFMTQCRNNGTPINDRTTTIMCITLHSKIFDRTACATHTESASDVTWRCTSCIFILRFACCTNMEAPLILSVSVRVVTVHFRLNNSFICGECHCTAIGIYYKTSLSRNYHSIISCTIGIPHGMRSQDIIFILHFRIIGNVVLADTAIIQPALRRPNTNRKFSKDIGISNLRSSTSESDYRIIMAVNVIFSLKSVSHFHAFQLPRIYIIKINGSCNRIYICQVISNQAYPVNRTCRQ